MKLCPDCKRPYEDSNSFCVFDGQRLEVVDNFDPNIGLIIDGKYRIDQKIAKGGTGMVYQATHVQLNAPVAIKIIHPNLASDPRAVERFRREALITMKVRHTNSIAVMDFGMTKMKTHIPINTESASMAISMEGVESQSVYVVMELLNGETLEHRLHRQGYFTPMDANAIIRQVCAGLAVAHEHSIVHRDLKPENVFFHRDEDREVVKLVDFGIAKYKGKVEEEENMQLTQAGFVVGTPFYMSPEQCGGFEVDARSDVYSLGVILYQLLTGRLPFEGNKASIIVMKHITDKPKPIYQIRPEIPAVLNGVVMHALEKKPENRPQNVMELAHELDSAVRVITEKELQNVFLNATEDDLEAALLLASEPGSDMGLLGGASSRNRATGNFDTDTAKSATSEAIAISDSQQVPVSEGSAVNGLFLELLHASKELSSHLQLISDDLEGNMIPERDTLAELKNYLDQMRGIVFGLYTTHYKN